MANPGSLRELKPANQMEFCQFIWNDNQPGSIRGHLRNLQTPSRHPQTPSRQPKMLAL